MKNRKTSLQRALPIAAAVGLLIAGRPAWSQTAQTRSERKTIMTMQDDVAHRAPEIHWPVGFDPAKADLFSHNELLIGAPCERVWQHIVDATKWPEWYPNSKDVRIVEGAQLAQGAVFRWTTFGLPLESKINEFVPYARIGWYGYARPARHPAPNTASITPSSWRRKAMPAASSRTKSGWARMPRICARRTRA
jgi:Polyketide cyclase / dehydrase and lipid transport